MEIVERLWRRVMDSFRPGLDLANSPPLEVLLLGERYASQFDSELARDMKSRIWVTYRTGFEPLSPGHYTSDVGWGCMIRSGQMLVANAMVQCFLGRTWRLDDSGKDSKGAQTYCEIMTRFVDTESPIAPLSLHKIAKHGAEQLGIAIGSWFGPSTVSQSIKALLNGSSLPMPMRAYVAMDGMLCRPDAIAIAKGGSDQWTPLLILVPLRLGIEVINPVYYGAVKECFQIPSCVGIAGGKPNSSLYLLGSVSDYALHLDPHVAQPTIPVKESGYRLPDFESYHFDGLQTTAISRLDPSLVLAFACKTAKEFDDCCEDIRNKLCGGKNPLFAVMDQSMDSLAYDSVEDTDDF